MYSMLCFDILRFQSNKSIQKTQLSIIAIQHFSIVPRQSVDCRWTGHWSCHLLTVLSLVWSIYIHDSRLLYTATLSVKTF